MAAAAAADTPGREISWTLLEEDDPTQGGLAERLREIAEQ